MSVMFHHTWTYQALAHDLLDVKLNSVKVQVHTCTLCIHMVSPVYKRVAFSYLKYQVESEGEGGTKKVETKTYDLDHSDAFWAANAGNPWPKVAGKQSSRT